MEAVSVTHGVYEPTHRKFWHRVLAANFPHIRAAALVIKSIHAKKVRSGLVVVKPIEFARERGAYHGEFVQPCPPKHEGLPRLKRLRRGAEARFQPDDKPSFCFPRSASRPGNLVGVPPSESLDGGFLQTLNPEGRLQCRVRLRPARPKLFLHG